VGNAKLLDSDGNAVAHRATQYLLHRIFVTLLQVPVTVLFISFKNTPSLQISGNPEADPMQQLRQFTLVRRIDTMKPTFIPRRGCIDPIKV
jgi:hypothetical protein